MKKIAAVMIAVVIAFSLCGCYNPSVVGTADGVELTAGIYLYFQLVAIDDASRYNDSSVTDLDSLYSMTIEGMTGRDWIANKTVDYLREYAFVENEYSKLDVEISDELQSSYDYNIYSAWQSNGNLMQRNGISYKSFYTAAMNAYKRGYIFDSMYLVDGAEKKISNEDIQSYFAQNYAGISLLSLPMSVTAYGQLGSQGVSDLRESTGKLADAIGGGMSFEDAFNQYSEPIFKVAQREASDFTQYYQGAYVVSNESTAVDQGMLDSIFELKVGEAAYYINYDGVYVFMRRELDENAWQNYIFEVAERLKGEEFTDYVTEGADAVALELDTSAAKYYSIDKAVLSA